MRAQHAAHAQVTEAPITDPERPPPPPVPQVLVHPRPCGVVEKAQPRPLVHDGRVHRVVRRQRRHPRVVRVDVRVHGCWGGETVRAGPHASDGHGAQVADGDGAFGQGVVVQVRDGGGVRGREDVLVEARERGAVVPRLLDKRSRLRRGGGVVVRHQVQAGLVARAEDHGVDVREDGAVEELDSFGRPEAVDAVHGGDASGVEAGDEGVGDGGLVGHDGGGWMDPPGGVEGVDRGGERADFAVEEPLRDGGDEAGEDVLDGEEAAGKFEVEGEAVVRAGELGGMWSVI